MSGRWANVKAVAQGIRKLARNGMAPLAQNEMKLGGAIPLRVQFIERFGCTSNRYF
jgi:hypothetical protein